MDEESMNRYHAAEADTQTKQLESLSPSGAAPCCASSWCDVRIHEQWENGFYGMFHGKNGNYQITFERDHPGSQWAWIVRAISGAIVASGTEPKGKTLHEVLHAAGCGANLWHNVKSDATGSERKDHE